MPVGEGSGLIRWAILSGMLMVSGEIWGCTDLTGDSGTFLCSFFSLKSAVNVIFILVLGNRKQHLETNKHAHKKSYFSGFFCHIPTTRWMKMTMQYLPDLFLIKLLFGSATELKHKWRFGFAQAAECVGLRKDWGVLTHWLETWSKVWPSDQISCNNNQDLSKNRPSLLDTKRPPLHVKYG